MSVMTLPIADTRHYAQSRQRGSRTGFEITSYRSSFIGKGRGRKQQRDPKRRRSIPFIAFPSNPEPVEPIEYSSNMALNTYAGDIPMPFRWGTKVTQVHVPGRTGTQEKQEDIVIGYDADRPVAPAGPSGKSIELGPLGKKTFGSGLILLSLWLLGSQPDDWFAFFLYALLGIGILGLLKGLWESRHLGAGRPFWLRFLPVWAIFWGGVISAGMTLGTPHMRMVYNDYRCQYLGLNGVEITRALNGQCAFFQTFPLRRSHENLRWSG
ncbi:MAG: hypothetical protein AAGF59_15955 [Pseudomonadota bacterium]